MIKLIRKSLSLKVLITTALFFSAYQFYFSNLRPLRFISLKYSDIINSIGYNFHADIPEIKDIIIVKIDDDSIKLINKKLPWPRIIIGELLSKITPQEPKIIVLDLFIFGESETPQDDALLAEELGKNKNTLLASYFDENGNYALPGEQFRNKVLGWGFVNRPRDMDLRVRKARLVKLDKENKPIDYSLSLKTAALYLGCELSQVNFNQDMISLPTKKKGLIKIPVDKNGIMPLNILLNIDKFQNIPFWSVLNSNLPPNYFKDKIVLIGATAEMLHDNYSTPAGFIPGVALIANDSAMIISKKLTSVMPDYLSMAILLLTCWLTAYIGFKFPILKGLAFNLPLILILAALAILLIYKNIFSNFLNPILLGILTFLGANLYKYSSLYIESSQLKGLIKFDEITGIYAYSFFVPSLRNELNKSLVKNKNLSLVIMSVDHIKDLKNAHGHKYSQLILTTIAKILKQSIRKSDILSCYKEGSFAVILRETNQRGALGFAEKIRRTILDFDFSQAKILQKVTLSFGVCGIDVSRAENFNELIMLSEKSLTTAISEGGNKVCFYTKS